MANLTTLAPVEPSLASSAWEARSSAAPQGRTAAADPLMATTQAATGVQVSQVASSSQQRNAILVQLHRDRRELERRRRTQGLSENEAAYLVDLIALIDRHEEEELMEQRAATLGHDDVWTQLDRLATRVLAIGQEIEAKR